MDAELNQFDSISSIYDRLARIMFGSSLHDLQCHFLSHLPDHSTILIIAGGTGFLLQEVLHRKPHATIIYVEASSKMILLARQRVNDDSRVTFIHGTQNSIPAGTKFDVVITPFFLDLFSEQSLRSVVSRLRAGLTPHGIWLATDFCRTARLSHQIVTWIMYRFFRMMTNIEAKELPRWELELSLVSKPIDEKTRRNGLMKTVLYKISE